MSGDMGSHGPCEWVVNSPYRNDTCGRSGYGYHVRTCWQHRDKMLAELIYEMETRPSPDTSDLIRGWIASLAPQSWDDEDAAARRAEGRRYAILSLAKIVDYYGTDGALPLVREAIDGLVDAAVRDRLQSAWGAA